MRLKGGHPWGGCAQAPQESERSGEPGVAYAATDGQVTRPNAGRIPRDDAAVRWHRAPVMGGNAIALLQFDPRPWNL